MKNMKNILRHISSFIAPITLCFVIPYFILLHEHFLSSELIDKTIILFIILGLIFNLIGLILLVLTIRMFILIGNGTIMSWHPTKKLVVVSFYAYVRNPMLLSIIIILLGESITFVSHGIAMFAILSFILSEVYLIFAEEPGLEKRFGKEYIEYKRNVPRWIPRFKPWKPNE